jgi:L-rhamnose mutarotase
MADGEEVMSATRRCFTVDLTDDPEAIAAYRLWHAPGGPPAAVTRSIRSAGISGMEIWLSGNRLFMIMETEPDFSPEAKAAADAADPEVQAWEALMSNFQRPVAWSQDVKWAPAEQIFDLGEQP